MRRLLVTIAGGTVVLAALAGAAFWDLTRPSPARSQSLPAALPTDVVERGRLQFLYGDLGVLDLDTLETTALPWVVLSTVLALDEARGDPDRVSAEGVAAAFRAAGFLYPDSETGGGVRPPLGLSVGTVTRTLPPLAVRTANLGCAACHAGVGYDPEGRPLPGAPRPGMPNTSLDLEAYTRRVYRASKRAFADEARLWRAIDRLHPDLSMRERLTLRWLVLPRARARLQELGREGDAPLPFSNGAPGLTNGVAALKLRLGLVPPGARLPDGGFVSIPDLADRSFRTALLADGAYAPPGKPRFVPRDAAAATAADPDDIARIGSFFIVPSMGMTPERAEATIPVFRDIARYLATYRPQPFPGPVDHTKLPLGREVYARACASCHGSYDQDLDDPRLVAFPNWAGDVGTDMGRPRTFDAALAARVGETVYRRHIAAESTGRMAAPLLAGLWATAPYFTNGSVPTLRDVLEPDGRPARFRVGGHRLDFERVGIAREAGDYRPFAAQVEIDTTRPGFSNRGHEREVAGLDAAERDALLEYLKRL